MINTSHPEMLAWLGLEGVRVVSVADLDRLRCELEPEGVATIRSMRDMNFSLPFNIHPLLAGHLASIRPKLAKLHGSVSCCCARKGLTLGDSVSRQKPIACCMSNSSAIMKAGR